MSTQIGEPCADPRKHATVVNRSGPDSLRGRFRRTMFFQEPGLLPNFEFGYWDLTLDTWHAQGLPDWVQDEASAYEYFGIENWTWLKVSSRPLPVCDYKVLEETEERLVYRDEFGCIAEVTKKGNRSIPHYHAYPVQDRATWQPFKASLDPCAPERWKDFEESLDDLAQCDAPIGVDGGSMAGLARNLMGFERYATLPYEDPALFEEITETFAQCTLAVLARALPRIEVDFSLGWEDICYNSGPIIGPDIYGAVIGPWYRRIAEMLNTHGVCIYGTDSDGNITPIADAMLDNGMNTMFPVEVHAGSDPCALRQRYGKRVRLWGGVNKHCLISSKEAIDRELERIRPCVEQGGFIPTVDHRVPADVPLAHYLHYLDRKRELFHTGGVPRY